MGDQADETGVAAAKPSPAAVAATERRQAKLESVREQVENGTLVIRQMTDEERERYPPRPRPPAKRKS